ncbi:MAG: aspartate-semialdehyde dehydrogenase [Verrucomicrobia bacterium]|nr:aspartate-semialdehyde dehydrogenase [Verrucomicrobiota bacterium]MBS0646912.1 aspartate-semialdehyde dehydrogenase [Verrucomicrobiota bacterium]
MEKIPVGILGATGMVGQKFVELLSQHPWFEIVALAASDRSVGKNYEHAMAWSMPTPLCRKIAAMPLSSCLPQLPCAVVFSGLDSSVATDIELSFAQAGYTVISNSSAHRMRADVPLLIPEINSEHLQLLENQQMPGALVTNPNCSVIGITMALKPILDIWGIEALHAVTLQALSGAGYPGVPSMDILDNVIPYIAGEEAKIESEPLKIFGNSCCERILPHSMRISAQCNRVAVADGHLACISIKLKKQATATEILQAWKEFKAEPQQLKLPTAPLTPLIYLEDNKHPQPKLHRHLGLGMSVSIGRLRTCSLLDWKFVLLSHNTVRGAAGCAVLNAELMAVKGYLKPQLIHV